MWDFVIELYYLTFSLAMSPPVCIPIKWRSANTDTKDDNLFPNLSVREMIRFSALLRLPETMTRAEKVQRGEDVIREVRAVAAIDMEPY